MRLLLTLLALIAGFLTPGMTVASAATPVAGTEQVDAGAVSHAVIAMPMAARPQTATRGAPAIRQSAFAAIRGLVAVAGSLVSDRPLE